MVSMSPFNAAAIKGVHMEPTPFIHGSSSETFLLKYLRRAIHGANETKQHQLT
jgi:hypothetical protein